MAEGEARLHFRSDSDQTANCSHHSKHLMASMSQVDA